MSTEEDATPGPAVQRLAPEDIHLIAGAVADIIRSPSTASPLTLPSTSQVTASSGDNTMDTHEGFFFSFLAKGMS